MGPLIADTAQYPASREADRTSAPWARPATGGFQGLDIALRL